MTLKGGGAFCWHLWQDPNTIARSLRFGCVGRIRDIDLELDVQPAAQNYTEVAIVAALCDAVDCLNSHFPPMVLASIRSPTTFRIVHSPPVCTRHWVGPEHVWCHGHRRGPIVVIRRGTCHGNTKNFELWRIALAVADANGRIHYLPFIDISYHPMAAKCSQRRETASCARQPTGNSMGSVMLSHSVSCSLISVGCLCRKAISDLGSGSTLARRRPAFVASWQWL